MAVALFFAGINIASTSILPDKLIFLKDQHSKLYHPGIFYFTSVLYLLPLFMFIFIFSTLLFYFGNGMNDEPGTNLLWVMAFCVCNALLSGMALGSVLGVVLPNLKAINSAMPIFAMPLVLTCGAFVTVRSLIWPLFLFSYLSPVRFVF